MVVTQVCETDIRKLYHYQKFDPDWLNSLISDSKIRFSGPGKFNDPWDCRPCFNSESLSDPAYYERHVTWFKRIGRANRPDLSEDEHLRRDQALRDPNFMRKLVDEASATLPDEINSRYRVYCLTTKPANILMWAHYAENHSGICLEFDTHNPVFSGALKVSYREEYPPFDLSDDSDDASLLTFLTKSLVWQYEDEYRLVAQERKNAVNLASLICDDNFLNYHNGALTGIILGHSARPSTKEAVRKILKSKPEIKFGRAAPIPNRYNLEVVWET